MSDSPEARVLEATGKPLPEAPPAVANYLPFTRAGSMVFVSGQLPMEGGAIAVAGKLGDGVSDEEGIRAAVICAVNGIAQLKAAAGGDLGAVRIVKITGFVNSAPGFVDQPKIINGASDLLRKVFGEERGAHARSAVSAASLPKGAAVEVELIAEIS